MYRGRGGPRGHLKRPPLVLRKHCGLHYAWCGNEMKFELEMKMISSGPDHNYGVQFKLKLKHATFDSIMFDSEDVIETLDVLKNVTYKCQSLIHQQSTGATQKPKVEKYFYNHKGRLQKQVH